MNCCNRLYRATAVLGVVRGWWACGGKGNNRCGGWILYTPYTAAAVVPRSCRTRRCPSAPRLIARTADEAPATRGRSAASITELHHGSGREPPAVSHSREKLRGSVAHLILLMYTHIHMYVFGGMIYTLSTNFQFKIILCTHQRLSSHQSANK